MVIGAYNTRVSSAVLPEENAAEASYIDGVRILPTKNLRSFVGVLKEDISAGRKAMCAQRSMPEGCTRRGYGVPCAREYRKRYREKVRGRKLYMDVSIF